MSRANTYTFATLPISEECYNEIAARLAVSGYEYKFLRTVTGTMIDMTGIALVMEEEKELLTKEQKELLYNINKAELDKGNETCKVDGHDLDCMCHVGCTPRIQVST